MKSTPSIRSRLLRGQVADPELLEAGGVCLAVVPQIAEQRLGEQPGAADQVAELLVEPGPDRHSPSTRHRTSFWTPALWISASGTWVRS